MDSLLQGLPTGAEAAERFEDLLVRPGVRLERIVSTGQATPLGAWLDQAADEWVLLVAGRAGLTLEGEAPLTLVPGDHLLIPAHRRHRVDWTDTPTVWLALHLDAA
ncbi:MAG TPA: cupin domain-containing protein [Caulobacteraceae bacterium]|nr:cupin domain-containing protein [Caulobacteraceae bacterium]